MSGNDAQPVNSTRSIPWATLLKAGGLAALLAIIANLLVRTLTLAIFDISEDFEPLRAIGPMVFASIVGAVGGTIVFAIVIRLTSHPVRWFTIIAVIFLVFSFLTVVGASSETGSSASALSALVLMHILTAVIIIVTLTTMYQRSFEQ